MMRRLIIVYLFFFSFLISEAQFNYKLVILNSSKSTFGVQINGKSMYSIDSSKSMEFLDTLLYGQGDIVELNISDKKIYFVVENGATIQLNVYRLDSLAYNKGYKFSGLPIPYDQDSFLTEFLPQKFNFNTWVKKEYKNLSNPSLSMAQRDSVTNGIILNRKKYLSLAEDFITSIRHSYLAYYLFRSEFLNQKSILHLGKSKVISIYKLLDTTYRGTEIGKSVLDYMEIMKESTIGSKIKNFSFRTQDKKRHNLYEILGDSQGLLIFTAKWCGACISQVPTIKELAKKLGPNLKILYVSLDRSEEQWLEHLKKVPYPGMVTLNLEPYNYSVDLTKEFMVNFIPQIFLIDKNREILYDNLSPYEDDSLDELKKLLGFQL